MVKYSGITSLIVALSLSLVGLLAIQFYWINSAIELKEKQFDANVYEVLNSVVRDLEKIEAMETIDRSTLQGFFMPPHRDDSSLGKIGLHSDSMLPNETFKIRIKEQITRDTINGYIRSNKTTRKVIEDTSGLPLILNSTFGEYNIPPINNPVQEEMSDTRVSLVENLFSQWLKGNIWKPIEERVSSENIDSLLMCHLMTKGVKVNFGYGLLKDGVLVPMKTTPHQMEICPESVYSVRLFPGDFSPNPNFLVVHFPGRDVFVMKNLWVLLTGSLIFLIIIAVVFSRTISTILKQKKLSEIKNDFINNMTHELKTPISTISLACEALSDQDLGDAGPKSRRYASMINTENKRLSILVENVLRSAALDKGEIKWSEKKFSVNDCILKAVESIKIQIESREGNIGVELAAVEDKLVGDNSYFSNIIYNLLDNAIKYSPDKPQILVKSWNEGRSLFCSVSDKGIGISKEEQKRIFEKFYRVPTGDRHDVKGFGLGLSYVKSIVERQKGKIQIQSAVGLGSTFIIEFPYE